MFKIYFFILSIFLSPLCFSSSRSCDDPKCTLEIADFLAGKVFEDSTNGQIDVSISILNDNTFGVSDVLTGRKLGNDFGDTHGVIVEVARTDSDGVNYKFIYFTNVYSQRESENYRTERWGSTVDQFFTEENIIKIILNNKEEDNNHFVEVGVGVMELNRKEVRGWLTATGQQLILHDAIGSVHPNNISSSRPNELGAFAEVGIGKQLTYISDNEVIRIVGEAKVSTVLSTIKDASSTLTSVGADYYYQATSHSWAYRAGVKVVSTFHETDPEPMNNLEFVFGVGKGNYSFDLIIKKIFAGHKQNYQDYNSDREAIFTLQFSGKFGAQRRY